MNDPETSKPLFERDPYEKTMSHEVYHWPEFQAFAKRLRLDLSHHTQDININLPFEGLVTITQIYLGLDEQQRIEG